MPSLVGKELKGDHTKYGGGRPKLVGCMSGRQRVDAWGLTKNFVALSCNVSPTAGCQCVHKVASTPVVHDARTGQHETGIMP